MRRILIKAIFCFFILFATKHALAEDLFISDSDAGCIYKVAPDGGQSTFASGLNSPSALSFDKNGNLFVIEGYNILGSSFIEKFTPDGTRSIFASGLFTPCDMVFDNTGDLLLSDPWNENIYKFTPNGTKSLFLNGFFAFALAFDNNGNLFVSDGLNEIIKITPQKQISTVLKILNDLPGPRGLICDKSGNLFEADYGINSIHKIDPNGIRTLFADGFSYPLGLALDCNENLFVADEGSGNIYMVDSSGNRTIFASGFDAPKDLAFSPVPEPSSIALLLTAILGSLLLWRWSSNNFVGWTRQSSITIKILQ